MCAAMTCTLTSLMLRNVTALAQKRCYPIQVSKPTRSARSVFSAMQSIDRNLGSRSTTEPEMEPCFTYTPDQKAQVGNQPRIADLVCNKTAKGEFFYGIEITAHSQGTTGSKGTCVDFNEFLPVLPTFISIAWLPHYFDVEPIKQVKPLQLTYHLEPYIPAMPHICLYRMSKKRFDEFFALNFTNVLAVRGDKIDETQDYLCTHELVKHARRVRGDSISIAVAGHPEGYVNYEHRGDMEKNMRYMKLKMESGADFIITQLCYTTETIINYIKDVHSAGIKEPVMVGVVVPDSFKSYVLMEKITSVRLPDDMREEVKKLADDNAKASAFFIRLALDSIKEVLDADLGVYGIQFYTMNNFGPVQAVLNELRNLGIIKEPKKD